MMLKELLLLMLGKWLRVEELELLTSLLEVCWDLVSDLRSMDVTGQEKRELAIREVAEWIDRQFDNSLLLPNALGWEDMTEERRDRILTGLVEIILWILEIRAEKPKRARVRLIEHIKLKLMTNK